MSEQTITLKGLNVVRGDYNPSITYYKHNIVKYKNCSYECLAETSVGIEPKNSDSWKLISGFETKDVVIGGNTYQVLVSDNGSNVELATNANAIVDKDNRVLQSLIETYDSNVESTTNTQQTLEQLKQNFDTLVGNGDDVDGTINTFTEIEQFLKNVVPGTTLDDVIKPLSDKVSKVNDRISKTQSKVYLYTTLNNAKANLAESEEGTLIAFILFNISGKGVLSEEENKWLTGGSGRRGYSSGDIVLKIADKSSAQMGILIPTQDAKSRVGDFPGADGVETAYDKLMIEQILQLQCGEHLTPGEYNADQCLEPGFYYAITLGRPSESENGEKYLLITSGRKTFDNGYQNALQIAFSLNNGGKYAIRYLEFNPNKEFLRFSDWAVTGSSGSSENNNVPYDITNVEITEYDDSGNAVGDTTLGELLYKFNLGEYGYEGHTNFSCKNSSERDSIIKAPSIKVNREGIEVLGIKHSSTSDFAYFTLSYEDFTADKPFYTQIKLAFSAQPGSLGMYEAIAIQQLKNNGTNFIDASQFYINAPSSNILHHKLGDTIEMMISAGMTNLECSYDENYFSQISGIWNSLSADVSTSHNALRLEYNGRTTTFSKSNVTGDEIVYTSIYNKTSDDSLSVLPIVFIHFNTDPSVRTFYIKIKYVGDTAGLSSKVDNIENTINKTTYYLGAFNSINDVYGECCKKGIADDPNKAILIAQINNAAGNTNAIIQNNVHSKEGATYQTAIFNGYFERRTVYINSPWSSTQYNADNFRRYLATEIVKEEAEDGIHIALKGDGIQLGNHIVIPVTPNGIFLGENSLQPLRGVDDRVISHPDVELDSVNLLNYRFLGNPVYEFSMIIPEDTITFTPQSVAKFNGIIAVNNASIPIGSVTTSKLRVLKYSYIPITILGSNILHTGMYGTDSHLCVWEQQPGEIGFEGIVSGVDPDEIKEGFILTFTFTFLDTIYGDNKYYLGCYGY